MSNSELRSRAQAQLGMHIFGRSWLLAAAACALCSVISLFLESIELGILTVLVSGPLNYGLAWMFLKQARDGAPMRFGDLFCGFSDEFGQTFLIGLMTTIYTTLWTILFFPVGIAKGLAYSMAYFIKADQPELDWRECITMSRKLMKGHKMELFVLHLSFIGWHMLGVLAFVVGSCWSAAYEQATVAQFYDDIRYRQWSELY